jgi:predicted metal-binding membrane protein
MARTSVAHCRLRSIGYQLLDQYRTDLPPTAAMTSSRTTATTAALAVTLGLAAASWVVTVRQMNGMDMGAGTELGSFPFFVALWVSMMAAMMLPGATPAVLRRAHASGRVSAVPLFVGSYLAVWTLVGVVVYALYRPQDLGS